MSNREMILEEIYKEMLEIEYLGQGKFKHKHYHIMSSFVRSSVAKYSLDWPADIIRDECYFMIWKAIKKFEHDYTIGELELILKQMRCSDIEGDRQELRIYLQSLKSYAEKNIRNYLLSDSRKGKDRKMLDVITEATDFTGIEYLMSHEEFIEKKPSHFAEWCVENMEEILTKKQVEFMNNIFQEKPVELTPYEAKLKYNREYKYRNRISDKFLKAYNKEFTGNARQNELKGAAERIEMLLNHEDFVSALSDYEEVDYLIEAIYDYVAIEDIKKFNKAIKECEEVSAETIKAYRVALFKKLKSIYQELEC